MDLYPIHDRMLQRQDKEKLLGQRGIVLWMYGLSGSGKSTIAIALEKKLHERGLLTQILDGDNIRGGLNHNLGFSDEDRGENIRRIAEVAKLYCQTGVVTLASFICPQRSMRQMAREIIGGADFMEIYIQASFETCAARDPKGLYKKVAAGQVAQFTGKDSAFEPPAENDAAMTVDTEKNDIDASVKQILDVVEPVVRFG